MKQASVKTLGVVALGAAIATTSAGSAAALVGGSLANTAGSAVGALPLDRAASAVHGGPAAATAGQQVAGAATRALSVEDSVSRFASDELSESSLGSQGNLLGGLPPGGLGKATQTLQGVQLG